MPRLSRFCIACLYSVGMKSGATRGVKLQAADLFRATEFDVLTCPTDEVSALHLWFISGDSKRRHHIHCGVHQNHRRAEKLTGNSSVDAALNTVNCIGKWFGREVAHAA